MHLDVYVRDVAPPPVDLGARVLADYSPERMTLADVEGNEFCAFIVPSVEPMRPAWAFAVCTDSDRPEGLVGAEGRRRCPRRARRDAAVAVRFGGLDQMVWKFVRVTDERVVPNRWRWTVYDAAAGEGEFVDRQGNEFSVRSRGTPRTSDGG